MPDERELVENKTWCKVSEQLDSFCLDANVGAAPEEKMSRRRKNTVKISASARLNLPRRLFAKAMETILHFWLS